MDRLTIDGNFCDIAQCTNFECADHVCDSKKIYERLRELEKLADDWLLVALPCKEGDTIFSLCWSIKNEKYELHTSEIKNVRYDSADGSITVSDGERFRVLGKTAFLTREAAEAALEGAGG